jgi:hypothetical protein
MAARKPRGWAKRLNFDVLALLCDAGYIINLLISMFRDSPHVMDFDGFR